MHDIKSVRWAMLWLLLISPVSPVLAAIDAFDFDNPELQKRYTVLIDELRCPKCQNQNIAGSDAPLAADLRKKVHTMLQDGQSDGEIIDFMVQRYGDFITYRPPLKPITWALWFGPGVIIILIGLMLAIWIRRRSRQYTATELNAEEQQRLHDLLAQSESKPQ